MRLPAALGFMCLLALGATAPAMDRPRAEPLRKATGCEWAGPGFAKVEGSDTCVKVDGNVRAEFMTSTTRTSGFPSSPRD